MDGELELPEMTLTLDLQSFLAWLSMAIVVSVVLAKVIGRRRTIVDSLIDAAPGVNNSLSARYRLVKQLGRGASSDVWLAEQLFSGRQVAVKVYRSSESNPTDRARLEREARVATALSSPQAPQFIDQCRSSDGDLYLVYEFIQGESLSRLMQTYGEMPEGLVIHVLTQLSSYLKSLHQLGWIHGDLQPSNLILTSDEQRGTCLTVIDLGLARPTDGCSVEPAGSVTAAGVPEYMSPEATRGIDQLTVASDIYALGCLGYAMIAGEPPIIGNNPLATCSKQRTQQPIALHELVPETDLQLSELIMSCLAKSPEDRPENCQLIEQELAAIAQRRPWSATESAAWWLCTEML